jgi:hypothetical protein
LTLLGGSDMLSDGRDTNVIEVFPVLEDVFPRPIVRSNSGNDAREIHDAIDDEG